MTFNSDNEQDKAAEELFKGSIQQEGAREVAVSDDDTPRKSRSEQEAESPDTSDFKITIRTLFPTFSNAIINRVAKAGMVARIAPEVFLDQMYLTVTDVCEMWDEERDGELDVQEIINLVYFALSIGIDGKGRVDVIQVSANTSETKESSTLGSSLGLS